MTNAFTPSRICSPVRDCLLTGRLPSQHVIHNWLDERHLDRDLLEGEVNLAELL